MYSEEIYNFTRPLASMDKIISGHATTSPWLTFVRRCEPTGMIVYEMKSQIEGQVVTQLKGKSGNSVGHEWDGSMGEIRLRDLGRVVRMTIIRDFPYQRDGKGAHLQLEDGVVIQSLIECQEWEIGRLLHSLLQDGIVQIEP